MTRRTCAPRQDWTVGASVRVGFLRLTVTGTIAHYGPERQTAYTLVSEAGARYIFTPYAGLERAQ